MDQLHHRGRLLLISKALRYCLIGAAALALAPISMSAQSWMEDGKTCFCLRHPTLGILRGCTGTKFSGDIVTARCSGGEPGDAITKLKVESPWTPIKNGDDGCTPCTATHTSTKEVPRGEGE